MAIDTEANAKEKREFVKFELFANKLCSLVGQQLEKHYPGWRWLVECHQGTGIVTVKNLHISGDYGFVLNLSDVLSDVEMKLPVIAGGELLERCSLPRTRRKQSDTPAVDPRGTAAVLDTAEV